MHELSHSLTTVVVLNKSAKFGNEVKCEETSQDKGPTKKAKIYRVQFQCALRTELANVHRR